MKIALTLIGNVIDSQGGVEKVLCNMANAMAKRGHEVIILAAEDKDGKPFFQLDKEVRFLNLGRNFKFKHLAVNLRNLFERDKDKREYRRLLYSCPQLADRFSTCIKEENPDIFVSFEKASLILLRHFLKVERPVVMMYHFNADEVLANRCLYPIFEEADCMQVLMPNDMTRVRELVSPKKLIHIPNSVPQSDVIANYSVKKIVHVGRIDKKQKRQHIIIEAYNILKNKFPDWKVEFWGDTSFDKKYYEYLMELLKKYNLEENIKFCGVSRKIEEKLADASIYAFPSAYEGFSLAMTEAMSIGLPVIGCESSPGVNDLIEDGKTGFLVQEGIEAFAEALDKLMSDRNLREQLGKAAKESMARYAPEKIWDDWEELLSELIKRNRDSKDISDLIS